MSASEDRPACTAASLAAGEPLAGTAPVQRAWLLVEHPGPWGRDPLTDAPWPDGLGTVLREAAAAAGVKVLAARRHRAEPGGGPPPQPQVVMSWTGPDGWNLARRLASAAALTDLPLGELAAGRRPAGWAGSGWQDPGALWAVCTHGRRDACCARLGRPLAAALAAAHPDATWEVSHTGGHRLGAVVIALPEGTFSGRVTAEQLPALVGARARGEVLTQLLRGHCHLAEQQQAAESALRRHLNLTAAADVRPLGPLADPQPADGLGPVWCTEWAAAGGRWRVAVRRAALPDRPASCGKPPEAAWAWQCATPEPIPLPAEATPAR